MAELVDIVDEDDRVIATAERLVAHRGRLPHRIVAILAFDIQDRIIIQVRRDNGLLDHSVGGHVDAGETYLQAAAREAQEELGLSSPLEYVDTLDVTERGGIPHRMGVFTCMTPPGWVFTSSDEVDEILILPVSELVLRMSVESKLFASGFLASFSRWWGINGHDPH